MRSRARSAPVRDRGSCHRAAAPGPSARREDGAATAVALPPLPPALVDGVLAVRSAADRATRLRVAGRSMQPLLRPGDVVELEGVGRALQPGDVVAYRADEQVVIHRVVRVGRDVLVAAGDNRVALDQPTPPAAVLGRVRAVERGGRRRSLDSGRARLTGRLMVLLRPPRRGALVARAGRLLRQLAARVLSP